MVIAIVVSTPGPGDMAAAIDLASAAFEAGHEVGMFVMSDAVRELLHQAPALASLADGGCDIWACATSVDALAVSTGEGVKLGSQDDHAALVHGAHRVVAFT